MIWLAILGLVVIVMAVLIFVTRAPRSGWEALAAALVLGLAGYALQGRPYVPAAPHPPAERVDTNPAAQVAERQKLAGGNPVSNQWMVIADAFMRQGEFADAATVVRGAIDKDPKNGEAWLALANALVGHAEGSLSPAALYAYRHAAEASPGEPGPPFFLGLALARSGKLDEARGLWAALLARSPKDAPWRPDLEKRLARLDQIIAMARNGDQGESGMTGGGGNPPR